MGNIGWTGIIIIAILVVILFGKGKMSDDNPSENNNTDNNPDNSNSDNK